jgi:hypothetical protein
VDLGAAGDEIRKFALDAAEPFRKKWPEQLEYQFNLAEAKKLLAKKEEAEPEEG